MHLTFHQRPQLGTPVVLLKSSCKSGHAKGYSHEKPLYSLAVETNTSLIQSENLQQCSTSHDVLFVFVCYASVSFHQPYHVSSLKSRNELSRPWVDSAFAAAVLRALPWVWSDFSVPPAPRQRSLQLPWPHWPHWPHGPHATTKARDLGLEDVTRLNHVKSRCQTVSKKWSMLDLTSQP